MSNGWTWANYRAWLFCHEYNFMPEANIKYEEVYPTNDIGSLFFANTSNRVKILVQYDKTDLKPK